MQTSTNSDKKLKIAMLGHKRIPSREGGVEIVVEALSSRMVGRGHKVTCYNRGGHHVSGGEYDREYEKRYRGIRLKKALTIDKKGFAAFTASISAAFCTMFGSFDVVHFHAEGPCIACFLPKITGKRVVATIHGLDHKRAKWGRLAKAVIMGGEKNAVKYADEIIVLSEGVKKYFLDTYGRETVLIPNGITKPDLEEADIIKDKWKLKKDDYILFLGRLVPEKGVHYLVEAYKGLETDKKLVIAGGSSDTTEYMEELKALAENNKNIIFTGFIQGSTLDELYSNAYVYVLPSDLEGMPLSLLEAMSYGNCCLTSDIEECAAVIKDYGMTFKAGNIEDLQEKLNTLINRPEIIEEYKVNAADYIISKYNWEDVTDRTLELYRGNKGFV